MVFHTDLILIRYVSLLISIDSRSISILLDALDDAGEQKRNNDNLHVDQIDGLLKVYKDQLNESNNQYRCSIRKGLDSARMESDDMTNEQEERTRFLQTLIFSIQQGTEEFAETVKTKNMGKI